MATNIEDYDPLRPSGTLSSEHTDSYFLGVDVGERTDMPAGAEIGRGLGDQVMLLEGLGEEYAEEFTATGFDPTGELFGGGMSHGERQKNLETLIRNRRAIVVEARDHRMGVERQITAHDKQIVDVLQPRLRCALGMRDHRKAADLKGQIQKLEVARAALAGTALAYAKTEAVAIALTKNAKAQAHLLELAAMAQKKGKKREAMVLAQAFAQIGRHSAKVKDLRRRQVKHFRRQTAYAKLAVAKAVAVEARRRVNVLTQAPRTPARDQAIAAERATLTRSLVEARKAAENLPGVMIRPEFGIEHRAAMARGLGDLGDALGWSVEGALSTVASGVTGGLKTAGGAISSEAKKIGHEVEAGVKKVGKAAKDLVKKGACFLASHPQVLEAAGTAGSGAVGGGGVGGQQAGDVAAALLSKACPSDHAQERAGVQQPSGGGGMVDANRKPSPKSKALLEPPKSKALPVMIAGGGAAVLLFALL